jgi:4-hydroxythreonine-4-phosphate dehydrogenase
MNRILALTMGDRYGVGPELVARLVSQPLEQAGIVPIVIGDPDVFAQGCAVAGVAPGLRRLETLAEARGDDPRPAFVPLPFPAPVGPPGHVSAAAGKEVLETLEHVVAAARAGQIDGLVYAPLNKQAMRDGGHDGGDEAELFSRLLKGEAGEINMLGEIWTSRVTSHVPLSQVASLITPSAVDKGIRRMHDFLLSIGMEHPRLAVAALNPHAGEGGAFGREEIDIIAPAVAAARQAGIEAEGPFPADSVFPQVLKGGYHAVVTMYHDQGQIALKLLGLGRGVTVIAGLAIPITTAGHGTAFDIAGKGIATPDGLAAAIAVCSRMIAGCSANG